MNVFRILVLCCVAFYVTAAKAGGQNVFYREFKVDAVSPTVQGASYVSDCGPESSTFTFLRLDESAATK